MKEAVKKEAKKQAKKAKDGISKAVSKAVSKSVNTDEKIKSEVKSALPSLVKSLLATPIAEMKQTQTETKSLLDTATTTQRSLDEHISNSNANMNTIVQTNNNNLIKTQKDLLSNLSQQYDMYRTGLSNEVNVATKEFKEFNQNISNASEKASQFSNEAKGYADITKGYADKTNRIYEQVFKKQSKDVIDQDNAEFASGKQGFTSMEYTTPTNLFDLEKDVVDAINGFNTTYYEYVRCLSGGSNCNVGTPVKEEDVIQASDTVNRKVNALQVAYSKANPQSTDATFKSNHESIMNKAKSVDELRRTLDTKMDTILKNKNPPSELTRQYDSTVYTGIMWSVLATSVLFYVFTEL